MGAPARAAVPGFVEPAFRYVLHYRTYEREPDDPWVVFVHGAGGSSSIWFKQLRAFKAHFNVLLVDLRGHGGSRDEVPDGDEPYTFESIGRDVLDVLDHLEIRQAHFVGISLGSLLIRQIADLAPDRVRSMVLGGAILHLDARSRFLVQVGHLFKRVIPFLWLYRLFAWIIMPRKRHREARALFVQDAGKLHQEEFLRWFRLTLGVNERLRRFRERPLDVPTLYLMGDEDHLFLPSVRAIAREHDASVLRVVEESGHVCNVDQPDRFNEAAIAFIQRHA